MEQKMSDFSSASTIETLNDHVSVRQFNDQPIADDMLLTMLEAARRSPTSSNLQTYSIVVVKDQQTKKELAAVAGNQRHIETCPVFFALCADISRLELVGEMHDKPYCGGLESTLIASIDASLVGMSLSLAAESLGLGTVMIGSMRNNPPEAARLLGLPQGVYVVFGLCVGWPEEVPPQKPRLPQDVVIHYERYSTDDIHGKLQAHDAELAEHYREMQRDTPDAAWTGTTANNNATKRRPELRRQLQELGFKLE
jgi:nitroreductase